ncbi:MAG: PTS sugar transporter subunit IIC [Selenomonadaceae bacterium]|nr:PTS sugar transporter subunit IIC [Selenomonadaceae bacterium]
MKMGSAEMFQGASFLPFARHLANNRYLRAVRHSFFAILPFLLAVSLIDVIVGLIFSPFGPIFGEKGLNLGFIITGLTGEEYLQHWAVSLMVQCRRMIDLGYGMLSIVFTMSLSRRLAEIWGADTLMTSLCALAAFLFFIPVDTALESDISQYTMGRRFLPAFVVAIVASRIYAWVSSRSFSKHEALPFLPKNLARFFNAGIPVTITFVILTVLSLLFGATVSSVVDFIKENVPLSIYQHPIFAFSYQGLVSLLWWFGFPGYGFTSTIQEIAYYPAQLSNQVGDTSYIFTSGFFNAGTLHILGLIIAILVFSNHKKWRRVAFVSIPCAFFNIQDPLMFCLPVILNPVFFIPYISAPIANIALGYVAILWGIVPAFSESVPWTMPVILSGIIGTDSFMGGALEVVWLITDIFIYAPFVITANMLEFGEDES